MRKDSNSDSIRSNKSEFLVGTKLQIEIKFEQKTEIRFAAKANGEQLSSNGNMGLFTDLQCKI